MSYDSSKLSVDLLGVLGTCPSREFEIEVSSRQIFRFQLRMQPNGWLTVTLE
jgi:hypothetical protein